MEKFGIECKKLMSEETQKRLKESSQLFVTSFNGLGVCEQEALRRKLKEIDVSLFVIKNRIAKRSFKQLDLESLSPILGGLTALTFGGRDSVSTSKALVNFAGKHEKFKIMGAYVNEQVLDPGSIKKLATIPSKEVLLTQIVYAINWPIQGLVNSLSATIKKFAVVIDRIREKKDKDKNEK